MFSASLNGSRFYPRVVTRAQQAAAKATKPGKSFLQAPFVPQDKLKPIGGTQFTSAPFEAQDELKHRPPEEKDFPARC
jgi:hypothetical protein